VNNRSSTNNQRIKVVTQQHPKVLRSSYLPCYSRRKAI